MKYSKSYVDETYPAVYDNMKSKKPDVNNKRGARGTDCETRV